MKAFICLFSVAALAVSCQAGFIGSLIESGEAHSNSGPHYTGGYHYAPQPPQYAPIPPAPGYELEDVRVIKVLEEGGQNHGYSVTAPSLPGPAPQQVIKLVEEHQAVAPHPEPHKIKIIRVPAAHHAVQHYAPAPAPVVEEKIIKIDAPAHGGYSHPISAPVAAPIPAPIYAPAPAAPVKVIKVVEQQGGYHHGGYAAAAPIPPQQIIKVIKQVIQAPAPSYSAGWAPASSAGGWA